MSVYLGAMLLHNLRIIVRHGLVHSSFSLFRSCSLLLGLRWCGSSGIVRFPLSATLDGGDPVSDVILHSLPRAVPQRYWFGVETLNAVNFLRDELSFNKVNQVLLNSSDLCLSPFVLVGISGT